MNIYDPPPWESGNRGKAGSAFQQARLAPATPAAARGSQMVRSTSPNLQDGPKPPPPLYAAGKRAAFDAAWREECRAWRESQSKAAREAFGRASGRSLER